MEMVFFFILLVVAYVGSRLLVDYYVKKKLNAWKNPSPLLGVVKPNAKAQTKKEEK
jgi:hypothetical protein